MKSQNAFFKGLAALQVAALLVLPMLLVTAQAAVPLWELDDNPVSYHPDGITYWSGIKFANLIAHDGRNWQDSSGSLSPDAAQIDDLGRPKWLNAGQHLWIQVGRAGSENTVLEPQFNQVFDGQFVLEWKGTADVRVDNFDADFVPSKSSGNSTGMLTDGRRVYTYSSRRGIKVKIYDLDGTLEDVKLWLPDPSDKWNKSLEGELFHPYYTDLAKAKNWNSVRMMGWGSINANPQKDWVDRKVPGHMFWTGIVNRRAPADGFDGDKKTGVPFEVMVAYANEVNRDLWICVPHLATEDFVDKMVRTIAYGSDGQNPYWNTQSDPVWEGLKPGLKVYVEYGNEMWSSGGSFPQGNWAADEAADLGIKKGEFVALQNSWIWEKFENHFTQDEIIRVAAVQSASGGYTRDMIAEFFNNASLLEPEVMAVATYFGNGIQNWAVENLNLPYHDNVKNSSYWGSSDMEADLDTFFDRWWNLVLSGSKFGGDTGFDEVGTKGGISDTTVAVAEDYNLPMVAYEGGPSLYTDRLDRGGSDDDAITIFIKEANRRPEFSEVYLAHINQAMEKGLWVHNIFVDVSTWGKFGQWGHLEYLGQSWDDSPKWQSAMDFYDEFSYIRHPERPLNQTPYFTTDSDLGRTEKDTWFAKQISYTGGNGGKTFTVIGSSLPDGMWFDTSDKKIKGTPSETGNFFLYARIVDSDGDPAWRTFNFQVYERSTDSQITVDFENKAVTVDVPVSEPYDANGMTFFKSSGSGLLLQDQSTGSSWNSGWESKVLKGDSWGTVIVFEEENGNVFDLWGLDVAAFQAQSVRITGVLPTGSLTRVINIPEQKDPHTWVELDFIGLVQARVEFWELEDAQGTGRNGAIDNLYINQVIDGDPTGGGGDTGEQVTLDNSDPQVSFSGSWWNVTSGSGYEGANFRTTVNNSGGTATYSPGLASGEYLIEAKWGSGWGNLGTDCPYTINHASGSQTIDMDQTQNGGQWVTIGTFNMNGSSTVVIGANMANNKRPVADAIRFTPTGDGTPPPAEAVSIDNSDPAVSFSGSWWNVTSGSGYEGANFKTTGNNSGGTATYSPGLASGEYLIEAKWGSGWGNLGTDCPYTINHASGSQTIDIDQTQNGGQWVTIGTFNMNGSSTVVIGANMANNKRPVADAIRFTPHR